MMSSKNSFYVTTPIYYVNDKPHIGHAYTTILADVVTRYQREFGRETFFLTGTDEHGQKVQQSADQRGISPQEHCDDMVVHFKDAWEKLNIRYDKFIRTTEVFHKKAVQEVLQDLWQKGEIYENEYGGFYCVGCERFYTEKELENGNCPQHQKPPEYIKEKNYFFKMSKYQEWLVRYIHENPDFIRPEHRKNEVLGFLKQPLEDLCISRPKSRLSWGVELPFDTDYVTYVWFDALLNYVTGVGYRQNEQDFKKWWPADYHLIGKDIVTTHCVYWPTMLQAAGIPLPKTIFAHGWWMMDKAKMSKSLKNIVSPLDLIGSYGVDAVRYYLIRDMMLGNDANFTEELFITRYNSELANDFGNLANRVSTLIRKNYDNKIPVLTDPQDEENKIISLGRALGATVQKHVDNLDLNKATDAVIDFIRAINKYLEIRQPWKLVREDKEKTGTVLYVAAEGLRLAANLFHPLMPGKCDELIRAFPVVNPVEKYQWGQLLSGHVLGEFSTLFPRIEASKKEPMPEPKKSEDKAEDLVDFDDFLKLKFKTAKVLTAEKIEGADKLLKITVDAGSEQRQLVAGIARHYAPEEIVGKNVVIVANLKPAKIRGIESQGMILAASHKKELAVLTPDREIKPGAKVS
ncbi:MAG: methionine--tRNA ligase [Candidatus Marinimicrobia bacterium]|nr:methionine--tRNA ligase [Candidatus Neomarinimicrobiota bacterium]